ncbi:hypothetical protein RIF29_32948 [Crotalaria pallida]|uniref:Legume lectin domain-containing protein n=1 Tax=Crotalaria pallida TaxID=3830 RepID=A0AAN9HWH4_CROPI
MLLLINVKSNSISFSFTKFTSEQEFDLAFLGDARPLGGVIRLTKRDGPDNTNLHQHSVGRVVYLPSVQLSDKKKGKLADFETEFSFVVDTASSPIHGDGFAFFIIPYDSVPVIPKNSTGGFLGLFNPETAFDPYKNQIVAVEFDGFGNEFDPNPIPEASHIGIDINSLESVRTVEWPINSIPTSIGKSRISYDSKAKELSVVVEYVDTEPKVFISFKQAIDLGVVLPEFVRIGFSGATGDQVETHDILSWSFVSRI